MAVATKKNRIAELMETNGSTKPQKGSSLAVAIPPIDVKVIEVWIKGETPLILRAYGPKEWDRLPGAPGSRSPDGGKKPKQGRPVRVPLAEALAGLHVDGDGHLYARGDGIKKAIVRAATYTEDMSMTYAKGAFFVMDIACKLYHDGAPIKAPTKEGTEKDNVYMRTDMVRIGPKKSPDIRYRFTIQEWMCPVRIRYNAAVVGPAQLTNLLNTAGFSTGIHEWRPEKGGTSGMFAVCDKPKLRSRHK